MMSGLQEADDGQILLHHIDTVDIVFYHRRDFPKQGARLLQGDVGLFFVFRAHECVGKRYMDDTPTLGGGQGGG